MFTIVAATPIDLIDIPLPSRIKWLLSSFSTGNQHNTTLSVSFVLLCRATETRHVVAGHILLAQVSHRLVVVNAE
jgi:hypothetical protein